MDNKEYIGRCIGISEKAVAGGNNPFGAILVDRGGNIIVESEDRKLQEIDSFINSFIQRREGGPEE